MTQVTSLLFLRPALVCVRWLTYTNTVYSPVLYRRVGLRDSVAADIQPISGTNLCQMFFFSDNGLEPPPQPPLSEYLLRLHRKNLNNLQLRLRPGPTAKRSAAA